MTSEKKIINTLKKINFKNYRTIYIAGNIYNFGFSVEETKSFCQNFLNNLKAITKNRMNIVVPTSTLDLLKKKNAVFTKNSKSFRMGIFSEYLRKLKGSKRSNHPLWSFSGIGKDVKKIFKTNHFSAYGKNSIFERLLEFDTIFISLGKPHKSIGMIHYAEHVVGVPYRFNKEFFIKTKVKNKIKKKYCTLGVRFNSKNILQEQGNRIIINTLQRKKIFKIIKLHKGEIFVADYKLLVNTLIEMLLKNPSIWLKNNKMKQKNYFKG